MKREAASQPRILVVDDDAGLLRLISKALKREGFVVATAASEAELKERLREGPFVLMMVDLRLADTTGPELLERCWARGVSVPFVVITGQGDERVAVEMMRKGALDYLVKDNDFLDSMPMRVRRAVDAVQARKRLEEAESALKREHAFVSAILDTAGAIVIVMDPLGRIVRFNRAAETVSGFPAQEVLGTSMLETLVPEEDRLSVRSALDRIRTGEPQVQLQGKLRTRDGAIRLIAWSSTRIVGDGGEPGFIIHTGIDVTEQRRLEEQIIAVSGREQRRIGQDLHDGLGQHLTGIELMTQCLEQALSSKKRPEASQAAKISQHVRDAIRQSKSLARGLSPVALDQDGLMSALHELATSTEERCRITCQFECPQPLRIEDNQLALHLYRIAQEAVNNAVKHGRPRRIRIRLVDEGGGRGSLLIQNDGEGFDPAARSEGMGLGIMHYRASVIGAALRITSDQTKGTEVHCAFFTTK
jgi:PAS domain S-box-containing protein